jgi:hypothetical protein
MLGVPLGRQGNAKKGLGRGCRGEVRRLEGSPRKEVFGWRLEGGEVGRRKECFFAIFTIKSIDKRTSVW